PPDLTEVAGRTQTAWQRLVDEEASATAEILLNTLDPYQREIEHHFALEGQRRFHGLMAWYLHLFTRAKYVGSTLRERVAFWPLAARGREKDGTPSAVGDLARSAKACSDAAASRHLDARGKALVNRLLVEADHQSFPVALLAEPVEAAGKIDWRQRHAQ